MMTISQSIALLTQKINEEAWRSGIQESAEPFAFFLSNEQQDMIAGCNGSLIYGAIYTDQLWVHPDYRKQGLGRQLMEKVHTLGIKKECRMATVCTMSFQEVTGFYEHLGYVRDFERPGYTAESSCLFFKKILLQSSNLP